MHACAQPTPARTSAPHVQHSTRILRGHCRPDGQEHDNASLAMREYIASLLPCGYLQGIADGDEHDVLFSALLKEALVYLYHFPQRLDGLGSRCGSLRAWLT